MVKVVVEGSLKTTARSGNVPLVKLLAIKAEGLGPTVNSVSGKLVGLKLANPLSPMFGIAEEPPPVKLPDNKDSVMGKRSPTKKVAGLPLWARIKTSRPERIRESESEKS